MGICVCKAHPARIVPSIPKSDISERQKINLAVRLVQIRRLEETPPLTITKSKLYQARKNWKKELSSDETLGSGMYKSCGSLEEVAKV